MDGRTEIPDDVDWFDLDAMKVEVRDQHGSACGDSLRISLTPHALAVRRCDSRWGGGALRENLRHVGTPPQERAAH
jgi:hypothetical protein